MCIDQLVGVPTKCNKVVGGPSEVNGALEARPGRPRSTGPPIQSPGRRDLPPLSSFPQRPVSLAWLHNHLAAPGLALQPMRLVSNVMIQKILTTIACLTSCAPVPKSYN